MKKHALLLIMVLATLASYAQPAPPVYLDVENVVIKASDGSTATITADIRMYNPNRYKMKLKDADVDVYINDNPLGRLSIPDKMEVPKQDTFLLPAVLTVDLKRLLPNALQVVLNNGMADLKLSGSVKAGRHGIFVKVPIVYEAKEDLGAMLNLK